MPKVWTRTRKCGCGECALLPVIRECPKANAPGAIQLWAQVFTKEEEEKQDDNATDSE